MKPLALAIVSGLLFALALPPYNWEWLGWVSLAPLLIAAHGRRPLEAVGLGLVAGLVGGLWDVRGLPNTDPSLLAWLPFLWLAVFFGVVALAGRAARARGWQGLLWIAFVACAGVATEWLTTFSPLPLNIALCEYRTLSVIQLASVTGIWGVSFLLWMVNAALADAFLQRRLLSVPLAVSVLLTVVVTALATVDTLTGAENPSRSVPTVRVAAIQDFSEAETASILPEDKTSAGADEPDREAMTRQAVAQSAKLIVWSEECLGAAFTPGRPDDPTNKLARQTHAYLVVGYSDNAQPRPHNCAALIGPDGRTLGVHHKMRLFLGERNVVQAGQQARAFPAPLGQIGVEICFDSLYTNVTRQLARSGAQIVAMPNFDPPTPRGVLHLLHAAMLPFRAVENRVPFVRSDSNGASQIIDATGRVVGQSPLWKSDVRVGGIALGDGRGTLFTRWGDWFAYLCVLFVTAGTIRLRYRRRKTEDGGEHTPSHQRVTETDGESLPIVRQ